MFKLNEAGAAAAFVSVVFGSVRRTLTLVIKDLNNLCQSPITLILMLQQMSSEKANPASINAASDMANSESSCLGRALIVFAL